MSLISITVECLPAAAFVCTWWLGVRFAVFRCCFHSFHRWIFRFFLGWSRFPAFRCCFHGFRRWIFPFFLGWSRFAAFRCCFHGFHRWISPFFLAWSRFAAFCCPLYFLGFPEVSCISFPLALIPLSFLQVCGAFWGGLLPLDVFNCQMILFICPAPIFKSFPLQRRNFETNSLSRQLKGEQFSKFFTKDIKFFSCFKIYPKVQVVLGMCSQLEKTQGFLGQAPKMLRKR